jgi:O-antigen/teichoic acid export membrane protein
MSAMEFIDATGRSARAPEAPVGYATVPVEKSLRILALQGAAWTVAGHGLSQVLRLGSNLVLTRLLFPEAFGLMALVYAILQGLAMFSDVGITPAIVQSRRGEDPAFLRTAWTLQVGRGVILWLACCALARVMGMFYEQPMLAQLLPVAGLTALLSGFDSTSRPLASRRLAVWRLMVLDLAAQVVAIAATITWACYSRTVWALVAGALVGSAIRMLGSHVCLPGVRCRFAWRAADARSLLSFGRWVFVSTLLTFLTIQGDRLLFGKLLSLDQLGVYSIAAMIAALPREIVARLNEAIVFPACSALVRGEDDLNKNFRRLRVPVLAATGAIGAGLAAAGPWLIALMYDGRYHAAGWMLQIVAGGIVLQTLEMANGSALLAAGRAASVATGSAAKLVGMVVLIPVGWMTYGMAGVLVAVVAADAVKYAVSVALVRRIGVRTLGQDAGMLALTTIGALVGFAAGRGLEHLNVGRAYLLASLAGAVAILCCAPLIVEGVRLLRAPKPEIDPWAWAAASSTQTLGGPGSGE